MALWRDNCCRDTTVYSNNQISSDIWTLKLPSVGTPHWCRAAGRGQMLAWEDILIFTENHFWNLETKLVKVVWRKYTISLRKSLTLLSPRVPVCQHLWDYLPLSAGAGPGVSQSEQGPRLSRIGGRDQYYWGRTGVSWPSCKYCADTACSEHLQYCSTAVTVTSFMWSDDIEVIMMSMKLPSNEEMKKWNVDQVQEFLAQV